MWAVAPAPAAAAVAAAPAAIGVIFTSLVVIGQVAAASTAAADGGVTTLRNLTVAKSGGNDKIGPPYLDEEGNICQDKMEMMQHVEYEKQIVCKVKTGFSNYFYT